MTEFMREKMPPLLIALTTDNLTEAVGMTASVKNLPEELVGFKIPRWFDQSQYLREACLDSGRYTVLDLQLDDGVQEMALNTRAALHNFGRAGNLLLPNAITMSPAKETVRARWKEIQENIIDFAHAQEEPVVVISHIDQTRMSPPDTNLYENEIDHSIKHRLPFDAFEVHADTVLHNGFPATDGQEIADAIILASRLGRPGDGDTPDDELINRIARTYRRGAAAIYLGNSIMRKPAGARLSYVGKVLEAHQDARELDTSEFNAKYPEPVSDYPKIVDLYK